MTKENEGFIYVLIGLNTLILYHLEGSLLTVIIDIISTAVAAICLITVEEIYNRYFGK